MPALPLHVAYTVSHRVKEVSSYEAEAILTAWPSSHPSHPHPHGARTAGLIAGEDECQGMLLW